MGRDGLGELEHQTMLALMGLGEHGYAARIAEELEARTGRRTKVAAVYIVLRRLEEKGFVASAMQGATGGGRDRRYFEVTEAGLDRLRSARRAYESLWEGLDALAVGDR